MVYSSRAGLGLIKSSEGCKLTAYLCPAGIPTIGWGETKGVHLGQTITQQQADAMLAARYDEFEAGVRKLVTVPLTDNQLGALTSFAYDCGLANLASSTLLQKLNANDITGASQEFMKWTKGGGRVLPGLVTRRSAEASLFLKP